MPTAFCTHKMFVAFLILLAYYPPQDDPIGASIDVWKAEGER